MAEVDAIVVGSGPNGLAAAITLARAGVSVLLLEAESTLGGGARSLQLTLPGFTHDLCSGIHPLAYASPFFQTLPLENFGLRWVHSPAPLAHPLDDGRALIVEASLKETAASLGADAESYTSLLAPASAVWNLLLRKRSLANLLAHAFPIQAAARKALQSADRLARRSFSGPDARAIFAGMAAHSLLPLEKPGTAGVALVLLASAHSGGWPFPQGGAQKISDSLADYFRALGGTIETNRRVRDLRELLSCRAVLLDLTPRQILAIGGAAFPERYVRALREYRYGQAAFKIDWALSDPVPWRSENVRRAATVHLGGTLEEIQSAERAPWNDSVSDRPFVIAAQHSLFDATRAPEGKHTLWAYCHVPFGAQVSMVACMEAQIERFAPGFRDCILARSVLSPRMLESYNANLVGGDISGGMQDVWQMLFRPTRRRWRTPLRNVYICSSSTPPGAGVHGMCGYYAARSALKRVFGVRLDL
jgi:phytoene dehydrogenase-like protein